MQRLNTLARASLVARATTSKGFQEGLNLGSVLARTHTQNTQPPQLYASIVSRCKSTTSTPTGVSVPQNFHAALQHYGSCFYQLSKFRLSALVVSTAAAGVVVGSGEEIEWEKLAWTSLGTMMTASAANTFNQLIEIKNDALMKRTMNRPLPSGRISRAGALAFALSMGVGGGAILNYKVNGLTAALGVGNIGLYALVYTPLKQISIVNTWVGAIVGAIPPLMGWAAARGTLDFNGGILAAGLYYWQMPHFFSLAWLCKADYAAGGYQMISLKDVTGKRTAAAATRNALCLLPLGYVAYACDLTTLPFAFESAAISAYMAVQSIRFYMDPTTPTARSLFRASLVHLPLLMVAMMLHRIPQSTSHPQTTSHSTHLHSSHPTPTPASDDDSHDDQEHPQATSYSLSSRVNLPALPTLSALDLQDYLPPQFFSCPSRATCEKDNHIDHKENQANGTGTTESNSTAVRK